MNSIQNFLVKNIGRLPKNCCQKLATEFLPQKDSVAGSRKFGSKTQET